MQRQRNITINLDEKTIKELHIAKQETDIPISKILDRAFKKWREDYGQHKNSKSQTKS